MSEAGTLPLVLGMWLPNIFFLTLTVFIFRRVEQEKPLIPERLQRYATLLFEGYLQPCYYQAFVWLQQMWARLGLRKRPSGTNAERRKRGRRLLIHANGTTGIFHLPACEQYNCLQCRIEFKNITIAKEAGFEPCGFCKTLLEQQDQQTTSSN